jgi:hypothetical protein
MPQTPAEHVGALFGADEHAWPHAPQFRGSLRVSAAQVLPASRGSGQAVGPGKQAESPG